MTADALWDLRLRDLPSNPFRTAAQ